MVTGAAPFKCFKQWGMKMDELVVVRRELELLKSIETELHQMMMLLTVDDINCDAKRQTILEVKDRISSKIITRFELIVKAQKQ